MALLILYGFIEISDVLDGAVARKTKTTSDFGKLFDPAADIVSRVACMFCLFRTSVWWPLIAFIMMREITMCALRMYMLNKGVVISAKWGGKVKAGFYASANIASLMVLTAGIFGQELLFFQQVRIPLLIMSCFAAYASLVHYFVVAQRQLR